MRKTNVSNVKELGHIAHRCPNVCCFECKEYGHIVVDCPHWIPPSGSFDEYLGASSGQTIVIPVDTTNGAEVSIHTFGAMHVGWSHCWCY